MPVSDRYPAAAWRAVSYSGEAGRFAGPPSGWILHVVVGNGSPWGAFEHAGAGDRRFSHLWVSKAGAVEQYAPLTEKSWAQAAGNSSWWSVETEGYPTEPLTEAQLDALAAWHIWSGTPDLLAEAPGQRGIGTHQMGGAAWGGHACPGPIRAGQRAGILARARQLRASGAGGGDMQLSELAGWDVSALVGLPEGQLNFQTLIGRVYSASMQTAAGLKRGTPVILEQGQINAVAAAVVQQLHTAAGPGPASPVGVQQIAAAVADELAARLRT